MREMIQWSWSKHAIQRAKERGFTNADVRAILRFGATFDGGEGMVAYWMSPLCVIEAKRACSTPVDHLLYSALILGHNSRIVTLIRATKPEMICWRASTSLPAVPMKSRRKSARDRAAFRAKVRRIDDRDADVAAEWSDQ